MIAGASAARARVSSYVTAIAKYGRYACVARRKRRRRGWTRPSSGASRRRYSSGEISGGRLQPKRATASDSSSPMLLAFADAVR